MISYVFTHNLTYFLNNLKLHTLCSLSCDVSCVYMVCICALCFHVCYYTTTTTTASALLGQTKWFITLRISQSPTKTLKKQTVKLERECLRGLFLSNVHQVFKSRNKYSYIDLLKKENILNRKPCKWDAQVDKNRTNAQKYLNIKHLIKSKAVLCLQSGFSLSLKAVVHLNWNVCSQIFHHLSWKH